MSCPPRRATPTGGMRPAVSPEFAKSEILGLGTRKTCVLGSRFVELSSWCKTIVIIVVGRVCQASDELHRNGPHAPIWPIWEWSPKDVRIQCALPIEGG